MDMVVEREGLDNVKVGSEELSLEEGKERSMMVVMDVNVNVMALRETRMEGGGKLRKVVDEE